MQYIMNKKAVVLLSGGLDSTTVLYWAKSRGYQCHCLIFSYGQRHQKEVKIARKIARQNKCPFTVVKINLNWAKSSLLDKKKNIPRFSLHRKTLPTTYVPGRNTIFLSYALSLAESIRAERIFIGANAIDFSGYPDCRPDYYSAWQKVLKALKTKIKIFAPLLYLSKDKIIRLGMKLQVPYQFTWSCYRGGKFPCGVCDSCRLRILGFQKAGLIDPLKYPKCKKHQ